MLTAVRAEALVTAIRVDHDYRIQMGSGESYHLADGPDPRCGRLPSGDHRDRLRGPGRQVAAPTFGSRVTIERTRSASAHASATDPLTGSWSLDPTARSGPIGAISPAGGTITTMGTPAGVTVLTPGPFAPSWPPREYPADRSATTIRGLLLGLRSRQRDDGLGHGQARCQPRLRPGPTCLWTYCVRLFVGARRRVPCRVAGPPRPRTASRPELSAPTLSPPEPP